jgi:hypothetical protein
MTYVAAADFRLGSSTLDGERRARRGRRDDLYLDAVMRLVAGRVESIATLRAAAGDVDETLELEGRGACVGTSAPGRSLTTVVTRAADGTSATLAATAWRLEVPERRGDGVLENSRVDYLARIDGSRWPEGTRTVQSSGSSAGRPSRAIPRLVALGSTRSSASDPLTTVLKTVRRRDDVQGRAGNESIDRGPLLPLAAGDDRMRAVYGATGARVVG